LIESAAFTPWSFRADGRIERTPAIVGEAIYLATVMVGFTRCGL
jgi:hypothetical protein